MFADCERCSLSVVRSSPCVVCCLLDVGCWRLLALCCVLCVDAMTVVCKFAVSCLLCGVCYVLLFVPCCLYVMVY